MFKSLKILAEEISSEIDKRDNEITGLQSKFDTGFQLLRKNGDSDFLDEMLKLQNEIEELRFNQRGLLTLLGNVNDASTAETVYEVLDCFDLLE